MTEVGANIRAIRESKGYTLKQLSELSGLSIGFISQVERSQTEPSLASLKKLSAALDIKMQALFAPSPTHHEVIRKGEAERLYAHQVDSEVLASSSEKMMEPLLKHIHPGGGSGGVLEPHAGEEFVWVKSGRLHITVGDSSYDLNEGDSIYFKSNRPHSCINETDEMCDVIWVSTPPIFT